MSNSLPKPLISIIIVHYKADKEFFDCLRFIFASDISVPFEVIVVDNDEEKAIEEKLNKYFPQVIYIKSSINSGYGAGNNIGAKKASSGILFFLNPDTQLDGDTVKHLYTFIKNTEKVGAVAPLLLDEEAVPFKLQGSQLLTPLRAVIVLSFINRILPTNPISCNFYLKSWDKKTTVKTDIIPGTAFMIKKNVFEKVGKFDENFFLYFEEYDLGLRLFKNGYSSYIVPAAKLIHLWKRSTNYMNNTHLVYKRSRFLYFRKHYGLILALFVTFILSINKHIIGVILIVVVFIIFLLGR